MKRILCLALPLLFLDVGGACAAAPEDERETQGESGGERVQSRPTGSTEVIVFEIDTNASSAEFEFSAQGKSFSGIGEISGRLEIQVDRGANDEILGVFATFFQFCAGDLEIPEFFGMILRDFCGTLVDAGIPFAPPPGASRTFVSTQVQSGGRFGSAVSGMQDVNDDLAGDVIIGAPGEAGAGLPSGSGLAYIYSGTDGALLKPLRSSNPEAGGAFGFAVSRVPNLDGDPDDDVIVGAYQESPEVAPATPVDRAGRAYVFSGTPGTTQAPIHILESPTKKENGRFGFSVAGLGDVNGDGRGDLAVGAPGDDGGVFPQDRGRAYIFSGETGEVLWELDTPTGNFFGEFGRSVARLDDVDGDDVDDLVVGALGERGAGVSGVAGRAHIFSGRTGELLRSLNSPEEVLGGQFGASVSGLGDIDGDGRGDVVVGAQREDGDNGQAHILSGATGQLIRTLRSPRPTVSSDFFASSVTGLDDVDADGRSDVAVYGGFDTIVAVFSGATGEVLRELEPTASSGGSSFGSALSRLPDVNGDGLGDLLLGSPLERPDNIFEAGRAFIFDFVAPADIRQQNALFQPEGTVMFTVPSGGSSARGTTQLSINLDPLSALEHDLIGFLDEDEEVREARVQFNILQSFNLGFGFVLRVEILGLVITAEVIETRVFYHWTQLR